MNIKIGDKVRVDGKEAVVTGNYGAGRHMIWKLDDGREVQDLHLAVASGSVSVVPKTSSDNMKTSHISKILRFDSLPKETDDLEE